MNDRKWNMRPTYGLSLSILSDFMTPREIMVLVDAYMEAKLQRHLKVEEYRRLGKLNCACLICPGKHVVSQICSRCENDLDNSDEREIPEDFS